jgi:hypothetical protein
MLDPILSTAGLVTIDVEPDNVWDNVYSKTLHNIKNLSKFHELCKEFSVRPTYLVSWSVASNMNSANILERLLCTNDCEIGIHPHLWEIPPFVRQDKMGCACVGLEYPEDILMEKISNLTQLITQRFGKPSSHRSGRWGIDFRQVKMLESLNIHVDSSVIPGINWSSTGILDHTCAPIEPYFIGKTGIFDKGMSGLLEVPCSIKPGLKLYGLEKNRYVSEIIKRSGFGSKWLRASPTLDSQALIEVCEWSSKYSNHLNLMSHSSEFMPNGSPYWKSKEDIHNQFSMYRRVFQWWQKNKVRPLTLSEFADEYRKK